MKKLFFSAIWIPFLYFGGAFFELVFFPGHLVDPFLYALTFCFGIFSTLFIPSLSFKPKKDNDSRNNK